MSPVVDVHDEAVAEEPNDEETQSSPGSRTDHHLQWNLVHTLSLSSITIIIIHYHYNYTITIIIIILIVINLNIMVIISNVTLSGHTLTGSGGEVALVSLTYTSTLSISLLSSSLLSLLSLLWLSLLPILHLLLAGEDGVCVETLHSRVVHVCTNNSLLYT